MKGKMTLHYDQESDYLQIFIEGSSPTYGQEVGEDITVFRNKDTGEVVGVGILNFKKRTKSFDNLKLDLPLNVNFSDLIL